MDLCPICLNEFEEEKENLEEKGQDTGKDIIAASCDLRHSCHSSCFLRWLNLKNICPICKAEITIEGLIKAKVEYESLISNI